MHEQCVKYSVANKADQAMASFQIEVPKSIRNL